MGVFCRGWGIAPARAASCTLFCFETCACMRASVGRLRGCMLSWDDFRYVKAIAEARSLAGAAECLGGNHSTVFRRLGQIEQHLGSRLFERGRAGYALTPCGTEMVDL